MRNIVKYIVKKSKTLEFILYYFQYYKRNYNATTFNFRIIKHDNFSQKM